MSLPVQILGGRVPLSHRDRRPCMYCGCELCIACHRSGPLGLMTGDIRDWQISASSTTPAEWDKGCHERFARLYYGKGRSWCSKYKAPSEWLQIDLGVAAKVSV